MELPSCPACNQSVLDDDASHCPFCGASMSDDGTSVPVAERPTAARTSPEEEPGGRPGVAAGELTPDDPKQDTPGTDPFAVDPMASRRTIPAAAKPTAKRPWRVCCPMCDTHGFVPRRAAGRDVRCANPKCLVPVFTAPAKPSDPAAESPPVEEPTRSVGGTTLLALLMILVAGGAGGAWWFFTDPPTPPRDPAITSAGKSTQPGTVSTSGDGATGPATAPPDTSESPAAGTADPAASVSPKTILEQAPTLMIAAAQERDGNRSKPFCRRLTAEYFAAAGQEQAAVAELRQLTQVGPDLLHLHVNALVELWWHRQRAGTAAPGPQLAEAIRRSASLVTNDPFAVDVAVALGCALIASDQAQLAESTVDELWSPSPAARLRLDQLRCRHSRVFHLANRYTGPPSLRGDASVDSLIIARLCVRGHSDAALAWARQAADPLNRAERLVAWTVAIRNSSQPAAGDTLNRALADEDASIRAVVHARLALVAAAEQRKTAAAASISRATQDLEHCVDARTVALGNLRQTFQMSIDDVSAWLLKVQAQAELIGALSLIGQADDAAELLPDTLATARSIGPARADIDGRLKLIRSMGSESLARQLKTALELTGNDEARQATQQFTRKCRAWLQLAEQRAVCLDRLHRWAILHGLGQACWKDIRDHGLTNDVSIRDPFTSSTLPSFLYLSFHAAGNATATAEMNRALPAGLPVDANEVLRQATRTALDNGKLDAVARAITADGNIRRDLNSRVDRRRVLFELVGVAAVSDTPVQALQLVKSLRDPRLAIWRENAYRLVAAQLATNGQHAIAWAFATHADRAPTERVALLVGLLEGIRVNQSSP